MLLNKYILRFHKKIQTLSQRDPTLDFRGSSECIKYGSQTAKRLFSDSTYQALKRTNQRIAEEERSSAIDQTVEAEWQKYHLIHLYPQTEVTLRRHARDMGNSIYDLPERWTGFRSQAAIDNKEKVSEHFYPRQWAGTIIINQIMENKGISRKHLRSLFNVFRQTHHTTSEENILLRSNQTADTFADDWVTAYNNVGIVLIQERDNGPILTLDGITDFPDTPEFW